MWKKGESGNLKGRQKGTPNKLTQSARQAFELAFERLGGTEGLTTWGKKNPTDFYKIYGRLIPTDVTTDNNPIKLLIEYAKPKDVQD